MKLTTLIITAFIFLLSCKKETIEPNYIEVQDNIVDTTAWNSDYSNGGTLPTNTTTQNNDLVGTYWVLTKIITAFSTEYPNDTIYFVDDIHYTLNNGAVRNYQLSNLPASNNLSLTLYYFSPFGGSHYSGQISQYYNTDGEMNNIEFEDIQNTSTINKAWLIKI